MSIKLSVAKISSVIVGLFRQLPSVKLSASLQSQGSWESFLTFHEKETSAGVRSIRDKGKGLVGRRKANFGTVSVSVVVKSFIV
jgi:hypothetical protein